MPARAKTSSRGSAQKRSSTKAAKKSAAGAKSAAAPKTGGSRTRITNYTTALRWLYDHTDYERMRLVRYNATTFNLERMRRLLKALGNPEKQLRFAHVAGTKGKGSTVAMLDSMLRACGYTVGSYTSPHLVDLRERIKINGQMISHPALTDLFKLVKSKARQMGNDPPTFFEIMTACAIRYFADEAVDLAILETGLGGRLDSTNVITPEICGISHISLDHTNVLGDTIADIAAEKAGIFKKNIPAVSVEQVPAVVRVFRRRAEEVGTTIEFTGKEKEVEFSYRFEANRELGQHYRVCLAADNGAFEHLAVPLPGEHQAHNCALALAMLVKLRDRGFDLPEEKVIRGLAETQLAGRMELAWEEPRVLLDAAHNGRSIQALIKAIGAHIPYDSLVMIFGCGQDKDIAGMFREVNLGADKVIFTRARSNPRAEEPADLLHRFNEQSGKMAQTAPKLEDALNLAVRAVSRDDLICVTGSFYLVGEAKKYLANLAEKRSKEAVAE
ncbi:MAG: hypothetical protein CMJ49_11010 [Planctomycetaceae bacterium]|nr:hypothetical protein [Planctomycetaceae bacterium]